MRRVALVFLPPTDPSLRGNVDVVLPVRNGARTITTALNSVFAQTIAPRRIIVVDDGSGDDTAQIVSNLSHPGIELIKTSPLGVSHARNMGIEAARAEFVAFLDADDFWHPDKLKRQLDIFNGNCDAAVVYCGHALLQPSGDLIDVVRPQARGEVSDGLLSGCRAGNSSSFVARRDALLKVGGYDESLRFGEDLDLFLRLAKQGPFDYAPDILAYLIKNPDSVSHRRTSPDVQTEHLLQLISVLATRTPGQSVPRHWAKKIRLHILDNAVRRGYGLRWMLQFRATLSERWQEASRQIWPNHVVFLGYLALNALGYLTTSAIRRARFALRSPMNYARFAIPPKVGPDAPLSHRESPAPARTIGAA